MFNFIFQFRDASRETKFFVVGAVFLGIFIVLTNLFAFLRLDLVRSYDPPPQQEESHSVEKKELAP